MARKFGFPNVAALEVGGWCYVNASVSAVKRKVALYGERNNKRFAVTDGNPGWGVPPIAKVERLPVTDAELPGVSP